MTKSTIERIVRATTQFVRHDHNGITGYTADLPPAIFHHTVSGNILLGDIVDIPESWTNSRRYFYCGSNDATITGNIADIPPRTLEGMRERQELYDYAERLCHTVNR